MSKRKTKSPEAGVPVRGVRADVWSWMAKHRDATTDAIRTWAARKGFNVNNALQERSAFKRFHGV